MGQPACRNRCPALAHSLPPPGRSLPPQAKAALPDEAFATYRAMLAAGVAPTPHTFSILVSACGRARQPQRAADVVERLMPQAGVAPQLPVWNALLGAYGRAGSVDAAYAAWVRMLESGGSSFLAHAVAASVSRRLAAPCQCG
ncbi:hypothetical protein ABPG75_011024 [Micractinium tetrahymenae]